MQNILKKMGMNSAQITFSNLVALVMTLLVFFLFAPILDTFIEDTITDLEVAPNEYTPMISALMRISLFVLLLAILITAINQANPRREGMSPPPY